jgi:hypothetical protein
LFIPIDAFGISRIVTLRDAENFYKLCTGITDIHDSRELTEMEPDSSNTAAFMDPQIFQVDDCIVKMSSERAKPEIEGAERVSRALSEKSDFGVFSIYPPFMVSIFDDGKLLPPQKILEFDTNIIAGRPVLQLMRRAPGKTLFCLLTEWSSTVFPELVFASLGKGISTMNAMGLYHTDLHLHNILVDIDVNTKEIRISFIDFERAQYAPEPRGSDSLVDCKKTFRYVLVHHFLAPVLADPSTFNAINGTVGKCLLAFLAPYCKESTLPGLIGSLTCENAFMDHLGREEDVKYWNDEKYMDERLEVFCKVLFNFRKHIEKQEVNPTYLPVLIKKLVEKKEFHLTSASYYHKILNLFSALFFRFTPEQMLSFLSSFKISEGKTWVKCMLEMM